MVRVYIGQYINNILANVYNCELQFYFFPLYTKVLDNEYLQWETNWESFSSFNWWDFDLLNSGV